MRALVAADFAVVEGELTSAVELAAVGTPFVYVPLSGHVEQESEVAPRLERLGIGRLMGFETLTLQNLARAYADALKSPYTASGMNLPVNGVDVATEVIQVPMMARTILLQLILGKKALKL